MVPENSEGEYAGGEVAIQSALFTEGGCERIMRFAFDLARTRTVKKVSSVTGAVTAKPHEMPGLGSLHGHGRRWGH